MTIQNVEVLLILDPLPALLVLTFNLLPVPALSTFLISFCPVLELEVESQKFYTAAIFGFVRKSRHHEIESRYWQTT